MSSIAASGEILVRCNQELTKDRLELVKAKGIQELQFIHLDEDRTNASVMETLLMDKIESGDEAIIEIYRRLRPSNPPTPETAKRFFKSLFFDPETYDISDVGRVKMNYKLRLDVPVDVTTLRKSDILEAVKYLINLKLGEGDCSVDDIDHLGNRRIRSVGELIENQYRIGLVRMERAIKEKMSLQDMETMMPHDLMNAKPVSAVVNEFFGSSQLSQFMDQTNPLSEITHKRRLSALGPGGLTRERAGFEVRDVHQQPLRADLPRRDAGRPEHRPHRVAVHLRARQRVRLHRNTLPGGGKGPRAQRHQVPHGHGGGEVHHRPGRRRPGHEGPIRGTLISARKGGEFVSVIPEEVELMDVSPNQLVSVAAGLIPFLEHDDANRALMGSNMQRQAVPLMRPEVPLVGTGMEPVVAKDSGAVVTAKRSGVVESVDASRIVVKCDEAERGSFDTGVDIYNLTKYQRSNQDTCFNQRPIVVAGDRVEAGDIIADGPATQDGELALGRNVMVAFMSWGGYNYEDSILVSERIVKEDVYTSIHIEEFETMARDTKLGKEEITRDIPNVGEEALRNLDDSGIVRMGVYVKPGDILVGKITPKGETTLSPEEKLLRAIFGEKASDVRDTSLRVPPGVEGIVIDAKVFTRKGAEKDRRSQQIEEDEVRRIYQDRDDEIRIISETVKSKIHDLLVGKVSAGKLVDPKKKKTVLKKGEEITDELLEKTPFSLWKGISLEDETLEENIRGMLDNLGRKVDLIEAYFDGKGGQAEGGRRAAPGRHQARQGLHRHQAQALRGRQDGGPPRQQGRALEDPSRGGHALSSRTGPPWTSS